ncbi:sensor histidine kinase [Novosphingobium jiangmenense]|uniref:histidine kinase n=1 Tax=Novosphingobium jiangmenense TaxID=2791981 RepID=A0ABS0HL08_9SPHN|nr:ATP-binding protein [Novosphingobium jiangmenense]MBF9152664.1 CHASE3 domain-containing protein [Novosphingobium jiangmenense]
MPTTPTYAFSRDAGNNRLILLLLSIGFAAVVAAVVAVVVVQKQAERDAYWVEHTLDVEAALNRFVRHAERTETARRGIIIAPTETNFVAIAEKAIADASRELAGLETLVRDNPSQVRSVEGLRLAFDGYARQARTTEAEAKLGILKVGSLDSDATVSAIRHIRTYADEMLRREDALLRQRNQAQDRTRSLLSAMLALCGALIVGVATAAILIIRRNIREIDANRRELHVLNQELESLVDERTAELQRANAEIQRFAYIVSHDLRSPLVNVMGFTSELDAARKVIGEHVLKDGDDVPQTVRLAVEEDLPESIGFIRSSTQKMDRLINAILRLSREGRRTLAPTRVSLADVVQSIVDSLQHRIDETGTRVELGELAVIETDRLAIEQILSNLIENALKYLHPGRPGEIRIASKVAHGRVNITVRDNGRGISPRDHERIFDLFRRSGMQDQPGEGIGLAHVRALAYRLGGLVEVSSEEGQGSTFTVSLPLKFQSGVADA